MEMSKENTESAIRTAINGLYLMERGLVRTCGE